MLIIDVDKKTLKGSCKVKDLRNLGLIKGSIAYIDNE